MCEQQAAGLSGTKNIVMVSRYQELVMLLEEPTL